MFTWRRRDFGSRRSLLDVAGSDTLDDRLVHVTLLYNTLDL